MKPWRQKCQSHGSRIRTAKTCSCYQNGTRQKHTITPLRETLEPIMASAAGTRLNLTLRKLIFTHMKTTSMNQTGDTGLWMYQRWFYLVYKEFKLIFQLNRVQRQEKTTVSQCCLTLNHLIILTSMRVQKDWSWLWSTTWTCQSWDKKVFTSPLGQKIKLLWLQH